MVTIEKHWNPPDPDSSTVDRLCAELDCHPIVATILANRGIGDARHARRMLDPTLEDLHDPSTLPGLEPAVNRLQTAVDSGETISVYGDRDIDGVAGTAILLSVLQDIDANVGFHIRGKWDAFGLDSDTVGDLADRGTDLLITVDCGTNEHDGIAVADAFGMDVIVTDHHPVERSVPPCIACLNPRRKDSTYLNDGLSGTGIAYKLGEAVIGRFEGIDREAYRDAALPLVAVATVADRAPLTIENRSLVHAGYKRLEKCPQPGLREAVTYCDVRSIRDLGWSLAPLLNAAQEAESGHLMLQLLLATDSDRIDSLLETLEEYRSQRQAERSEWYQEFESALTRQVDPADEELLVVETDGYVGGAPNRIADRLRKPVIWYYATDDGYRCQLDDETSIAPTELVESCEDLLEKIWGHPDAPRFSVSEDSLGAVVDRIKTELHRTYSAEERRPQLPIDATFEATAINRTLVDHLERLRPFGTGFDTPLFLIEGVEIGESERFGEHDEHVALIPHDAVYRCVWWTGSTAWDDLSDSGSYDIVGSLSWDTYRDTISVSVKDMAGHNDEPPF